METKMLLGNRPKVVKKTEGKVDLETKMETKMLVGSRPTSVEK